MKKCPYCAEEVQDSAVKCKHCHSDLKQEKAKEPFHKTFTSKLLIACAALVFGLPILLVFVSAFMDGLIETTPSQQYQARQEAEQYVQENDPTATMYVFDDLLHERELSVNLIEPQGIRYDEENNIVSLPTSEYDEGETIELEKSALIATDQPVAFYREEVGTGHFADYQYSLITFEDVEGTERIGWIKSDSLISEDELGLIEEYNNSPTGQLCAEYPTWEYIDCKRVADGKIWIGMNLDMLKEQRGLPDSANPSNYGSGTEWQWCWHDYTPRCFYGDSDGIIDAYN